MCSNLSCRFLAVRPRCQRNVARSVHNGDLILEHVFTIWKGTSEVHFMREMYTSTLVTSTASKSKLVTKPNNTKDETDYSTEAKSTTQKRNIFDGANYSQQTMQTT